MSGFLRSGLLPVSQLMNQRGNFTRLFGQTPDFILPDMLKARLAVKLPAAPPDRLKKNPDLLRIIEFSADEPCFALKGKGHDAGIAHSAHEALIGLLVNRTARGNSSNCFPASRSAGKNL